MELEIIPFLKIISDKIEYGFLFFQYMWIVGYYLEFCWNRMKSIKVSSIPTHSCIDSINRTRGSTSCGLSHNLTCIWQMWIHIYMYQSNLQATHVNLIVFKIMHHQYPLAYSGSPTALNVQYQVGWGTWVPVDHVCIYLYWNIARIVNTVQCHTDCHIFHII